MIIWGANSFGFSATRPENVNPWQSNGGLGVGTSSARSIVVAPFFEPAAPPVLGPWPDRAEDWDFWALSRLANVSFDYLEDVQQWISEVENSGDEPVDVFAEEFKQDKDLLQDEDLVGRRFGRPRLIQRRKRR